MERLQWRGKSVPWLAVLVALLVLVGGTTTAGIVLYQQSQQPPHVPLDEWLADSEASDDFCDDGVGWIGVEDHVGETVDIFGTVERVSQPTGVSGNPTFLEIGNAYPNPNRLNAVIWGQDADSFGGDLTGQFEGQTVCLTGTIETYQGVPQVTLRDPSDIAVESDDGPAGEENADTDDECQIEDDTGYCMDGDIEDYERDRKSDYLDDPMHEEEQENYGDDYNLY